MTDISEYYITVPEIHGKGTYFFTECGNEMYSINDENAYQGKLCPKCFWKGINRTLYKLDNVDIHIKKGHMRKIRVRKNEKL